MMDLPVEGTAREIEALLAVVRLQSEMAGSDEAESAAFQARGRRFQEAVAALPPEMAAQVESIGRRVRTDPVALTRSTHCPHCHVRFNASLAARLRSRSAFFFCLQCRRPLYSLASGEAPTGS